MYCTCTLHVEFEYKVICVVWFTIHHRNKIAQTVSLRQNTVALQICVQQYNDLQQKMEPVFMVLFQHKLHQLNKVSTIVHAFVQLAQYIGTSDNETSQQ